MNKNIIGYIIILALVPLTVLIGVFAFSDRQYAFISLAVAILSCVPAALTLERKRDNTVKLIIIACMTAFAVTGRFIFAAVPGFKPVTALVVITAMYMGPEAGFVTGALSAVVSNFYFGQGPWTPFQMFVWGLIGFIAGLLRRQLIGKKWVLLIYAIFSGILFSLLMDVWTVLWFDGAFNAERYLAAIVSAAPFAAIYAVSNVIFLFALGEPIGRKLERIKTKYMGD